MACKSLYNWWIGGRVVGTLVDVMISIIKMRVLNTV